MESTCVQLASHDLIINPPVPGKARRLLGNISKQYHEDQVQTKRASKQEILQDD